MKFLSSLLLSLYCACFFAIQAQSIMIKSSLNSSVETKGNLTFDGTQIELNNVNLSCNSLIVKNTVSEIKVSGTVKIECKTLVLEKGGQNISLEKSTGIFFVEYLDEFVENSRSFVVGNDGDFKLKFLKKPTRRN